MRQINLSYKNNLYKAAKHIDKAINIYSPAVTQRLKIIKFYREFGLKATLSAFDVSRPTLMRWQQHYKLHGLRGLIPCSRKPLRSRQSTIHHSVINFVLNYRHERPRVCQYTIKPELDKYCLQHKLALISTSSIERIIRKLKEQGKMPDNRQFTLQAKNGKVLPKKNRHYKKLRRGKYTPSLPGDIVQIDSVHLVSDGIKKYLITAIDLKSRFAYSEVYNNLNSLNAKDFIQKLQQVTPFKINALWRKATGSKSSRLSGVTVNRDGNPNTGDCPESATGKNREINEIPANRMT
jgi:hypothetical protein